MTDSCTGLSPWGTRHFRDVREVGRAAPVRDVGGLGIGLALSEGLVEMHDSSVSARSEGPGWGSPFQVRLPLAGTVTSALQQLRRASPAVGRTSTQCVLLADDNQKPPTCGQRCCAWTANRSQRA